MTGVGRGPDDYSNLGLAIWLEATWMVMIDGTIRRHDEAEARRIFVRGAEEHISGMHVAMVTEMLTRHPVRQFTGCWWDSECQTWRRGGTLERGA